MATAKKKKSTKTAKKTTKCGCKKCACKKAAISSRDRAHVCFVAALSIVAGILLCADAAIITLS